MTLNAKSGAMLVAKMGVSLGFLLYGIGHQTWVSDLNGAERIILAYFLAVLRNGGIRQGICIVSVALQVVTLLVFGPHFFCQWILLILACSTVHLRKHTV